MNPTHNNPFYNYGSVVYGENFVGRNEFLRIIRQRIINAKDPGCLSIVGIPRIGKSSLAYHSLIYPKEPLLEKRLLTIWINLPSVKNLEDLFRKLVFKTLSVLKSAGNENNLLREVSETILNDDLHWWDFEEKVKIFFSEIKSLNWRTVAVIDEFDRARNLFKDEDDVFNSLRDLAYDPEHKICIVTISRNTLPEIISKSNADVSTFEGIFQTQYINSFSFEEFNELIERTKIIGLEIDHETVEFIWMQTGGHPYLASVLAFFISDMWLNEEQYTPVRVLKESSTEFSNYYYDLVSRLQKEKSLEKLFKFLSEPIKEAIKVDAGKLARFGIVTLSEKGFYKPFSLSFRNYLESVKELVLQKEYALENNNLYNSLDKSQEIHYHFGHNIYTEYYKHQGNYMTDKSGIKIDGNNNKLTGVAGGDFSGEVNVAINELPKSSESNQPGLRELLVQLKATIETDSSLDEEDKAEALEKLKDLANAGKNPSDGAMKKLARTAIKVLKGTVVGLPATAKLVEASRKLLPLISKFFGL